MMCWPRVCRFFSKAFSDYKTVPINNSLFLLMLKSKEQKPMVPAIYVKYFAQEQNSFKSYKANLHFWVRVSYLETWYFLSHIREDWGKDRAAIIFKYCFTESNPLVCKFHNGGNLIFVLHSLILTTWHNIWRNVTFSAKI